MYTYNNDSHEIWWLYCKVQIVAIEQKTIETRLMLCSKVTNIYDKHAAGRMHVEINSALTIIMFVIFVFVWFGLGFFNAFVS